MKIKIFYKIKMKQEQDIRDYPSPCECGRFHRNLSSAERCFDKKNNDFWEIVKMVKIGENYHERSKDYKSIFE